VKKILLALALAACSGKQDTSCAVENITGTFPGVSISVRGDTCTLARGQAAVFSYEVTVDPSVPAVLVHGSGPGCGSCLARTSDPSTWVDYEIGGTSASGQSQIYCLCDVGCCAPDTDRTVQMTPGTVTGTIDWSGRTWNGPSDTGQPMGDFFEPGQYFVSVQLWEEGTGSVVARLPIEVR
jgi:hypothetical protein